MYPFYTTHKDFSDRLLARLCPFSQNGKAVCHKYLTL
jgi:hypothetical protein